MDKTATEFQSRARKPGQDSSAECVKNSRVLDLGMSLTHVAGTMETLEVGELVLC